MNHRRIDLPQPASPLTPTRVSVPFGRGELTDLTRCRFRDASGRPVSGQGRALVDWDDGSVKWALFVLDAREAASPLSLQYSDDDTPPPGPALAHSFRDGLHVIDTGRLVLRIPENGGPEPAGPYRRGIFESVAIRTADGLMPMLRGCPEQGLRITDHDGRVFTSSRVIETGDAVPPRVRQRGPHRVRVVETGPVRSLIFIEGTTGHDTCMTGLEYIVKLECYAGSSLLGFEVVWRHADDRIAHWIDDIRFVLPFSQPVRRVTFGLEKGYHTDRLIPGCAYRVLQQDQHTALAERLELTGQRTNAGWGTSHGRVAPGWMQAQFDTGRISAFMRDFHREYPNEIRIAEDRIEFGLWPRDANERISAMTILPPHPDCDRVPEIRHRRTEYDSLLPRPYWAFFDKDRRCLETVRGMQKGQTVWLDLDPHLSDTTCHSRARGFDHELNQATLAHDALRISSRYRFVYPPSGTGATSTDRAADWICSNETAFDIYGKWDAGDLIYMWFSPGFSKDADTKHWKRRQHPRIDYWNNNEEEPIHGLLLYFLSTGHLQSFRYAENMVRHFLDIDVQHHPHHGVHTHAPGHCFRGDDGTATDHFWCEGLIDHYLLSGDPGVREALAGIIDFCVNTHRDLKVADIDLRTAAIYLMQCATYHELLEEPRLLARARALGEQLAAEQMPEGHLMNFGSALRRHFAQEEPDDDVRQSFHGFFITLALEGLARLHTVDPDPCWADAFVRGFRFVLDHLLLETGAVDGRAFTAPGVVGSQYGATPVPNMISTGQLALVCPKAYELTRDDTIPDRCRALVELVERGPLGPEYGPGWAGMGLEGVVDPKDIPAYDADGNCVPATPENFAVQARPLMPSIMLRCVQPARGWLHAVTTT